MDSAPAASPLVASLLTRCSFPAPHTAVTVALSGGPDSMALMCLAVAHGLHVTAVHVDHGIRADSHRDINLITPVARVLGVELRVHRVVVEPGPNLVARARTARYGVLPDDAMTGHTADDQAETVLINLLRGAASAGLSAMTPGPKRPILGLRRTDTHRLCTELGIECVDDETNRSDAHQRNRVRH